MSPAKVQIISSSTIKTVHNPNLQPSQINLTAWDLELLLLEYNENGLVFPKPTPEQERILLSKTNGTTAPTNSLIDHLKKSLERTLQFFPPLAGRLTTTAADGGAATCFSVDCTNNNDVSAGALFIHATIEEGTKNLSIADILDDPSNYVADVVHSLFPLAGARHFEGGSRPLLAVQVTELVDGLFIGWSVNHLIADGTSFWHFFNSWAEISRGNDLNYPILSKLPMLNRDLITLDLTGSSKIKIDNKLLILDKSYHPSSQLKERIFRFTKENVDKLKAKANQEISEDTSDGKISRLQAVIAHIWLSIIRHRLSTNKDIQETTFEIPMGARQRLNPPLPEEYFGNAVFPGIVTLKAAKMVENGLGWTAWQINRMVDSSNNPDRVKQYYLSWIKNPYFLKFDELPRNHFILINSPRFSVYENDFGWGKPVAVRSGRANSFDGRITVFGGVEKGSMEIHACLFAESLCALGEDPEFMEFLP